MKSIRIFDNDELETEFWGVDIWYHSMEQCPYGRATEIIEFSFDKCIDHHPKQVWTGKFICVTNFKNELHYTPGKIYKTTKEHIYDDTSDPFLRGDNESGYIFSAGSFEELKKDFLKHNIDIIEYKGEA